MSDDNKNLMVVFSTSYHTPYNPSSRIWKYPSDIVANGNLVSPAY